MKFLTHKCNLIEGSWIVLACIVDNKIVGSLQINHFTPTQFNIKDVFVTKFYRGRGIGRKLIFRAVKIIKEYKAVKVIGLSVHKDNELAMNLYKKLGFTATCPMEDPNFMAMYLYLKKDKHA